MVFIELRIVYAEITTVINKDDKVSPTDSSGGKFRIFLSGMVSIVDYGILPLNPFANKIVKCPTTTAHRTNFAALSHKQSTLLLAGS